MTLKPKILTLAILLLLGASFLFKDQLMVYLYESYHGLQQVQRAVRPDTVLQSDLLLVKDADAAQDTTVITQNDIVVLQRRASVPPELEETSGLLYAGDSSFWSHNDSKNAPQLYMFNTQGELLHTLYLEGIKNIDWEDLAKDEAGNIYIGDFGNNGNNRDSLYIYKIPNLATINSDTLTPERIAFAYSDQEAFPPPDPAKNFDMEAMCVFRDTLYLFSKNRTRPYNGYTKRYWLPTQPGHYQATLIDSVLLETGINLDIDGWVSGAAISPNEEHLLLLSYRRMWIFSCFEDANFFEGEVAKINFSNFSQKEAVDFINDHEIFLTDERTAHLFGGRLYHADLSQWLSPCHPPDSLVAD